MRERPAELPAEEAHPSPPVVRNAWGSYTAEELREMYSDEEVRKSSAGSTAASDLPVWLSIKLGMGPKSARDFSDAFREAGHLPDAPASWMLEHADFVVRETEQEVDLVIITPAKLGIPDGATMQNVIDKARKLGLEECPCEVGPQLRLQYATPGIDRRIRIAMRPVRLDKNSFRGDYIFAIERCALWAYVYDNPGTSMLMGVLGGLYDRLRGSDEIAFVRPRKAADNACKKGGDDVQRPKK